MNMSRWLSFVRHLGAACLLAGGVLLAEAQTAAPPSIDTFFKPADMAQAQLSPSGRWIAALTSAPGRRIGFRFIDTEGKEGSSFVEASSKDDVVWFRWVSDDWLVFRVFDREDRRKYGFGSGLMATRRDGTTSRMLIARDWEDNDIFRKRRELPPTNHFLALGAPGSTEIIVGESQFDVKDEYTNTTLKALDVATGDWRTIHGDAPRAGQWWFDGLGRARVAADRTGGVTTVYWADKSGAWREIGKAPRFELPFWPVYVDGDDGLVVQTSGAGGSHQYRRFDFTTGKPSAQIMFATPGFDGDATVVRARSTGQLLGLGVTLDAYTPVWFTPGMQKLQDIVDQKLAGHVNVLSCEPCDDPKAVLIHSYAANDPGSWVLYRPRENKWELVGEARPAIDASRMARLTFHRIKARDGRDLPVWVTHAAVAKNAPAVVLVHGGPWVRGSEWEWNAEAQFLASRGYTVVQPEFRGSRGYGDDHYRAGWKQWGQTMQDDVTDALTFAVTQGWVDAKRVCIMGASYGGYSTLWGLVKDPDLYRCGIAFAALSDPRFMYDFHWNDISTDGKLYSLPQMLGDRKADEAMLIANSPLVHADRIKAPLLLVHGGVDRRVPIQNAERMRDALRKGNKNFEWVVYDDDGHDFKFPKNEYDFYARVETFLAKHLKP